MTSKVLTNSGDDWNNIFLTRDFDGNEDQVSEARSDSDSDADFVGGAQSESKEFEDEMERGPAIELHNTQILRDKLQGKSLVELVKYVLAVMDRLGQYSLMH
jgi:hypothetical protein